MNSEKSWEEFKARLGILIGDEKPFKWAKRIGISDATFDRVFNKGIVAKGDTLLLIREKTGVSIDWLLTGEGPPIYPPGFVEEKRGLVEQRKEELGAIDDQVCAKLAEHGLSIPRNMVGPFVDVATFLKRYNIDLLSAVRKEMRVVEGGASYEALCGLQENFILVPMMHGRISAGGGLVPDERPEIALAFQKEWVSRKGSPEKMSVIRVEGDSMSPTLQGGDVVLVNHDIHAVTVNGGIYAIAVNDQIAVKRVVVELPDHKLRVISDNKEYPEFVADASQLIINGQVIWYGRDLER